MRENPGFLLFCSSVILDTNLLTIVPDPGEGDPGIYGIQGFCFFLRWSLWPDRRNPVLYYERLALTPPTLPYYKGEGKRRSVTCRWLFS